MTYCKVVHDDRFPQANDKFFILMRDGASSAHWTEDQAVKIAILLNKAYTAGVLETRRLDNSEALVGMREMLALIQDGKADVVAEAYRIVIDSQEKQNG